MGAFAEVRSHVAAARRRRGLSQEDLADLAGVERSFLANLETRLAGLTHGGRRPTWPKFAAVCRALGEDPAAVLRAKGLL